MAAHILLLPCVVGPPWETQRRAVRRVCSLAPPALLQETRRRGEQILHRGEGEGGGVHMQKETRRNSRKQGDRRRRMGEISWLLDTRPLS